MNKLYIVLIIIFLICLCNNIYEGHTTLSPPHDDHGSCDCNPAWVYNYPGPAARKCHTQRAIVGRVFSGLTRDPRAGGSTNDRVKDYCRGQGDMDDCNNAIYPSGQGISRGGVETGACLWTGNDVQYHPHQQVPNLLCRQTVDNYRPGQLKNIHCNLGNNTTLLYTRDTGPTIEENHKNNPDINRSDIINSIRDWLNTKQLSEFTGFEIYNGYNVSAATDLTANNHIVNGENRYFSILVTGSDNDNDIGKIYKYKCAERAGTGPAPLNLPLYRIYVNQCPPEDLFEDIKNTETVVSLGEDNENYQYGIVLHWSE